MSDEKKYISKVPGSLMLFGEHAVLRGKLAIACSIDKFVTVELIPRADFTIHLESNNKIIGNKIIRLEHLAVDLSELYPTWSFVLTCLNFYQPQIKTGFTLKVISDYKTPIGLGSSAALTVATINVLEAWLKNRELVALKLLREAITVIRKVQGIGSGADAAASIFQGVVAYEALPCRVEKIAASLPLTVIYSGKKVSTKEVVLGVAERETKERKLFQSIFNAMDECSKSAKLAIKKQDWKTLGEFANIHQGLQDALGVNNETLSEIIFALRRDPNIFGAKISGSGLGDCVIGIGEMFNTLLDTKHKFIQITTKILCKN